MLTGDGALDTAAGHDEVRFDRVTLEVGSFFPDRGTLTVSTHCGHQVKARFVDAWPVNEARISIDGATEFPAPAP